MRPRLQESFDNLQALDCTGAFGSLGSLDFVTKVYSQLVQVDLKQQLFNSGAAKARSNDSLEADSDAAGEYFNQPFERPKLIFGNELPFFDLFEERERLLKLFHPLLGVFFFLLDSVQKVFLLVRNSLFVPIFRRAVIFQFLALDGI